MTEYSGNHGIYTLELERIQGEGGGVYKFKAQKYSVSDTKNKWIP